MKGGKERLIGRERIPDASYGVGSRRWMDMTGLVCLSDLNGNEKSRE